MLFKKKPALSKEIFRKKVSEDPAEQMDDVKKKKKKSLFVQEAMRGM